MTEISARQDLYRHVNGAWLNTHEIPADQGAYGAFMELRDEAEEAVHEILKDAELDTSATRFPADQPTARIAALYRAFMDTDAIEARGLEPIAGELGQIENVSTPEEFVALSAQLQRQGISGLIAAGSMQDAGDPQRMLLHLIQGGIGLPDESYYRDEKFAEILQAYQDHIAAMFSLTGIGGDNLQTGDAAAAVVDLEKKIAGYHWDVVAVRDAVKRYNLLTREDLTEVFGLANTYLAALGADDFSEVVAWQPDFLTGINQLLHDEPLDTWKLWLQFQVISSSAPYLSDDLVNEDFDFYGRKLAGTQEVKARWKRAVSFVNGAVGEDVAQLYVAKHFPAGHKEAIDELVATLLKAYRNSISSLDWMSSETRQRALEKLEQFNPMVGYPVKWEDYSAMEVFHDDLMRSVRSASAFHFDRDLAKIEEGPDPEEWHMTPQTVNAYYSPVENAIVFPAAILQPPFFDPQASAAENFGGIGAVIGHEIGHGFDDQGSRYAGDGSLHDWWTETDREAFQQRTGQLVDQYNQLHPAEAPDYQVNGELTLGENIGDLGGLGIAHQALELYLGETTEEIDREFFIAWATVWRQLTRRETMITRISADPHSPNEFRCNQVVKNLDSFHRAFGTQPGDHMWLDEDQRVSIW
ncbi:M13 family metallopeptidase [Auritidibacter ignavus]|uniref:M13 family metallopeptidase n=1 Tax=Auritidibacter ignavus TaxID=678932 RepID=UPI0024482AFE|nr:M13-type metalloendopeptidase [Auritidibacter ignavus]WGH85465.1 M13-type metalloendopeptidase [Auritidibacter ignavus]WGH87751.1 M13-type metalloendopeptidase [Auritidibacter ignavus]